MQLALSQTRSLRSCTAPHLDAVMRWAQLQGPLQRMPCDAVDALAHCLRKT